MSGNIINRNLAQFPLCPKSFLCKLCRGGKRACAGAPVCNTLRTQLRPWRTGLRWTTVRILYAAPPKKKTRRSVLFPLVETAGFELRSKVRLLRKPPLFYVPQTSALGEPVWDGLRFESCTQFRQRKKHAKACFFLWWRLLDSNQWPPACGAGALTSWAKPPYECDMYYSTKVSFWQ